MPKNVPDFRGKNLSEARVARLLSVEELANAINVSRQSIYLYEKEQRYPSLGTLTKIAKFLKLPIDFFTSQLDELNEELRQSPRFYRSMKPAVKEARAAAHVKFIWLVRLVSYISDFIELPEVDFPDFDIPSKPEHLSFDEVEEIAIKTRKYWGLGLGPIPNMIRLLESKGAIVSRCNLYADELDAFSEWWNNRPYIILGKDKSSAVRSRYDSAHELGHLVMHKNLPEKYTSKQNEFFDLIEQQAHRFAGAFLFPAKTYADETVGLNLELMKILKSRWKVSIAAQIKRGEDLGFITPEEVTQFWRNYTKRGWRKREPLDLEIHMEEIKVLKDCIELLVEQGVQDRFDIKNKLHIEHDLEEIAGLNPNYMTGEQAELIQLINPSQARMDTSENDQKSYGEVVNFPRRI